MRKGIPCLQEMAADGPGSCHKTRIHHPKCGVPACRGMSNDLRCSMPPSVTAYQPCRPLRFRRRHRPPLLRLRRDCAFIGGKILAKAEPANHGCPVKGRNTLGLLGDAEHRGSIRTGTWLVEGTPGNTGISCAGTTFGYRHDLRRRASLKHARRSIAQVRMRPCGPMLRANRSNPQTAPASDLALTVSTTLC